MKILFHTPTQTLRAYPRQDDLPVVGLDPEFQVFEVIQNNQPAYDQTTQTLEPTETIDTAAKKVTRGWKIANKPQDAKAVTIGALRIALGRDLCIQISQWAQNIPDPEQKFQAMSWWEYQPYVRRDHPVVEHFRLALGKTAEEVDAYFEAAKQLDSM